MSTVTFDETQLRINDVDKDEIAEGKWFGYPRADGVKLKIARMNNDTYLNEYVKLKREGVSEVLAQKKAMAKGVLTDWSGFNVIVEGEEDPVNVDHTEARAFTVLQNDPVVLDFVVDKCQSSINYINSPEVVLKKK